MNLRNLSIENKLMAIMVIVSSVTVLLACIVFIWNDSKATSQSYKSSLDVLTQVMADNCSGAVEFDMATDAEPTLGTLQANKNIYGAAIYKSGKVFARWGGTDMPLDAGEVRVEHDGNYFIAVKPILSDGKPMDGQPKILVKADTKQLEAQRRGIIIISLSVFAIASVISIVLSRWLCRRQISSPIEDLLSTIENVSKNEDFSIRATKHADDEIGQLVNGFNEMLNQTYQMMQQIQQAVTQLSSTTENIVTASQTQATGAAQQSASITETVAAVEESATQSGQISERSNQVAELAEQSLTTVQEGQQTVNQVIESMDTIMEAATRASQQIATLDQKSKAIEEVVALINNIASRTDLISLNAEIEAVNAGEFGKGFTVVANEVRNLAERTQDATQSIKELTQEINAEIESSIEASTQSTDQVNRGVELVKQTGVVLETIIDTVNQTAEAAVIIDRSTKQQQSAAEQLVSAMEDIDSVAQEVEKGANITVTSSKELEEVGQSLEGLLNGNHSEVTASAQYGLNG